MLVYLWNNARSATEVREKPSKFLGSRCFSPWLKIWFQFRYFCDFIQNLSVPSPLPSSGWISSCSVTRQFSPTRTKCKDQDQWNSACWGSSRASLTTLKLGQKFSDKAGWWMLQETWVLETDFSSFHSFLELSSLASAIATKVSLMMHWISLACMLTIDLLLQCFSILFPYIKHFHCGQCLGFIPHYYYYCKSQWSNRLHTCN